MNAKQILVVFVANGMALAQQPPPKPAQPLMSLPTISVQFAGGTLADYVQALKEAAPNFNIMMIVPEAKEIRVPALKLDSVGYYPALRVLQGDYRVEDGTTVKLLVNDLGGPRDGENASPVYKIWSERAEVRKPPAQVRVWNIGELIGADRKADDVLTAVETAVGLLSGYEPAKIRYHAETALLVASGEEEQLRAIDRVIAGIQEGRRKPGDGVVTQNRLLEAIDKLKETNASRDAVQTLQSLGELLQEKNQAATPNKPGPTRKEDSKKNTAP